MSLLFFFVLAILVQIRINLRSSTTVTYDHRLVRTGHPVRSAILKHQIGRSVVEWVTVSESLLLYVLAFFLALWILVELSLEGRDFIYGTYKKDKRRRMVQQSVTIFIGPFMPWL